jgi:hypothetical protein
MHAGNWHFRRPQLSMAHAKKRFQTSLHANSVAKLAGMQEILETIVDLTLDCE